MRSTRLSIPVILVLSLCSFFPYQVAHSQTYDTDTFSNTFDGPWGFGVGMDLVSADHFDGHAVGWGLHLEKEFYETPNWYVGSQLHASFADNADFTYYDDMNYRGTSLFITARNKALPALQFKAGVSHARYETLYGSDVDDNFTYGIALVTDTRAFGRFHWLDYEVQEINGQEFHSWSVSIVIIACLIGGCH